MANTTTNPDNKVLDLTAVEQARTERPVKVAKDKVYNMVAPEALGPRDFARLASLERMQDLTPEEFDDQAAERAEQAMTDAACIVLPDAPREELEALPFMMKQRLLEVFVSGFTSETNDEEAS